MVSALRQCRIFEGLDARSADRLSATCRSVVHVDARTDLARERQTDTLYVFLRGWGCRHVLFSDGRRQVPMVLLPGDAANLDVVGAGSPEYGVATFTPSSVALLAAAAVRELVEEDASVARVIMRLALQESRSAWRRNVLLACYSAREQFAHLMCELIERLTPEMGGFYVLPLTQSDYADVLGLSSVHVNRVLQGLRAEGLIQLAGKRLEVLNRTGLAAAGHFRGGGIEERALVESGGPGAFRGVAVGE